MAYRTSFIARRGRALTSWVATLILTAGVALGILAAGHHVGPVVGASATATTTPVTTSAPAPTTSSQTVTPISVTFRGDDGASSSGDY